MDEAAEASVGEEWVGLVDLPTRDEARIVTGLLRSHGVAAVSRLDDAGGSYPQLAARAHGGTTVLVRAVDLEQARALVAPAPWPEEGPHGAARRRRMRRYGLALVLLIWVVPALVGVFNGFVGGW